MTVVYFLISILFLILIHEWGHFAAARYFGVGVEKFSIGFGKALIAYTDVKTGTCWQLGPIPLGGFVGLLGEKTEESVPTSPRLVAGKPFMHAPLHAKIVILLAGVTVNLLFAVLAYGVLAYASANPALPLLAKPVAGSASFAADVQSGDLVISVNNSAVASWRDVQVRLLENGDFDQSKTNAVELSVRRANELITLKLLPQAKPSSISTNTSQEAILGLQLQTQGLIVQGFAELSSAKEAGMLAGDILVSINGVQIDQSNVLIDSLKNYQSSQNGVEMMIERQSKTMQLKVIPIADEQKNYKIGVQFALNPQLSERGIAPIMAMKEGFSTAYLASILTVKALGKFLSNPLKNDQLAGPVTIAKTAKISADRGWQAALAFLAGLSVSVGVLNLLPVPVLDGGQVLYHLGRSALLRLGFIGGLNLSHPNAGSKAILFDKIWLAIGLAFVVLLTLAAFYTDFMRLMSAQ